MPSRRRILLLALLAALAVPAAAQASVKGDLLKIHRGLTQAQKVGWLRPEDAARYRVDLQQALTDIDTLPRARGATIAWQLGELAAQWHSYISPRALALFGMLETNMDYLETHALPTKQIDIAGDDGVVYRWFWFRGFQFHPLANVGALNAAIAKGDEEATQTLVDSLLARAVPHGSSVSWEYYFAYGVGRPPWTSGMAQAVGAQALARASALLGDTTLLQAAQRAYAAVPGALVLQLAQGPWIRLYSFDRAVVLNAQLQAILSLDDYADASADAGASSLAASMSVAAQTLLPRFDTGYWSLYQLGGTEAPLNYELYVTNLLGKLATRTEDPVWTSAAARFLSYVKDPPQIELAPMDAPIAVYSKPLDNYLDTATVSFTLSKRSKVTLSAAARAVTETLNRGPHTLVWNPGKLPPGNYTGQLIAVDLAGNRTLVNLPQPFVVTQDVAPQQLQAQFDGTTLTWSAVDPGTPWLKVRVVLRDGVNAPQIVELGRQPLAGSSVLTLPPGTWQTTVGAMNSAGLWATLDLGQLTVPDQ